jgi:hypothetical protein
MFGFPWETQAEELNTLNLVRYLLRKGYAKTAQASTYSESSTQPTVVHNLVKHIYDVAWSPEFWINKLKDIHDWADVLYLIKGIRKGIVHD